MKFLYIMEKMNKSVSSNQYKEFGANLFAPFLFWAGLCLLLLTLYSCQDSEENYNDGLNIPPHGYHSNLSEYGFFSGVMRNLDPVDSLLPYDLNTELFSDYTKKQRFVYIPEGEPAQITGNNTLEFPDGSVLIKNFYYPHDERDPALDRTLIETRLLKLRQGNWTANTYVWNEEQNEAFLRQTGSNQEISWLDYKGVERMVNYRIPSVNDCSTCHSKESKLVPLGPEADNLNREYTYRSGRENQLEKWRSRGFLSADTELAFLSEMPVWDDPSTGTLNNRARAYLHVNCSSCHNPAGSARNSALFLEYTQEDPYYIGVCKTPVAAGSGSGGLRYSIEPGSPDESILFYRMESVKPQERMPEIGRTVVHEEAVDLIRDWIETMDLPACGGS